MKLFFLIILLSNASIYRQLNSLSNGEDYGELIVNVGKLFIEKPYISGSLDVNESEKCIVNLNGFDCVTFYETAIAIANLKWQKNIISEDNIKLEIKKMRYQDGVVSGYESRLHYSSQWILDNIKRNNFIDISKELGGGEILVNVSFMSKNNDKYEKLKNNSKLTQIIKSKEDLVNGNTISVIHKDKIKSIENKLKSGDLVFFKTNIDGLDYVHTGIVTKEGSKARLLHASINAKKVILDKTISEYIKNKKAMTGVTILRKKI